MVAEPCRRDAVQYLISQTFIHPNPNRADPFHSPFPQLSPSLIVIRPEGTAHRHRHSTLTLSATPSAPSRSASMTDIELGIGAATAAPSSSPHDLQSMYEDLGVEISEHLGADGVSKDERRIRADNLAEGERKYKEVRVVSPTMGRNHAGVRACEQSVAFVLVVSATWISSWTIRVAIPARQS